MKQPRKTEPDEKDIANIEEMMKAWPATLGDVKKEIEKRLGSNPDNIIESMLKLLGPEGVVDILIKWAGGKHPPQIKAENLTRVETALITMIERSAESGYCTEGTADCVHALMALWNYFEPEWR
ncbi:MAG: hypothetical protein HFE76_16940 [Firmicutes bacterium]|nr:hypothetical protein [Bacillota bacterium]